MNKCNRLWFFIALLAIISTSCTVEKRHYQNGFHVEWFHRQKQEVQKLEASREETTAVLEDSMFIEKQAIPIAQNEISNRPEPLQEVAEHPTSKRITSKGEELNERPAKLSFLPKMLLPQWTGNAPFISPATTSAELDPVASVLGIIAFMLGILAILSLIMALIVTEGWAALGWIIMMVIFGLATALFGLIAQTIFWSKHQGIPWFQWLPLVISGAAIVVLVKVLTGK